MQNMQKLFLIGLIIIGLSGCQQDAGSRFQSVLTIHNKSGTRVYSSYTDEWISDGGSTTIRGNPPFKLACGEERESYLELPRYGVCTIIAEGGEYGYHYD